MPTATLTYVVAQRGGLVYGAVLLFVYQFLGRWAPLIEHTSGAVVIGVGLYFLWIA